METRTVTGKRAQVTARGTSTKRVLAVGKRIDGRWQVRTSLWRYLATTALSTQ